MPPSSDAAIGALSRAPGLSRGGRDAGGGAAPRGDRGAAARAWRPHLVADLSSDAPPMGEVVARSISGDAVLDDAARPSLPLAGGRAAADVALDSRRRGSARGDATCVDALSFGG